MKVFESWKQSAKRLKRQTYTIFLAYKDHRTPWYARVFAGLIVAYAFSPIDLIPDFIPVLGYLDDLVLIPIGIAFVIRLIPAEVMVDCRQQAELSLQQDRPINHMVVAIIVAIWVVLAAVAGKILLEIVN